jgi:hypothetical protein
VLVTKDTLLDLRFPAVKGKAVVARFDGGDITSDSGVLLLSAADRKIGLTKALSEAIMDKRQSSKVRHGQQTLLSERTYAVGQGYEDANDLDTLCSDPALKLSCGYAPESDPALASQPTLSRFENRVDKKDLIRMGEALARCVVKQLPWGTRRVVLDIDAMEDPCHGQQQFEFFNAYYDSHCFLPLLLFVTDERGRQRLMGVLLRSGKAGNSGVSWLIRKAVAILRERFPALEIVLRADAGFGNDKVLRQCDKLKLSYSLCVSANRRLHALSTSIQMQACCKYTFEKASWHEEGVCREFGTIQYKAGSWDKKRTVIVKAEITQGKLNPRFVVTNIGEDDPEKAYGFYCARGDRENRIKEFKLDLAGGRTSCHRFLANQFRVILHAAATVLIGVIQEATAGTEWAKAQAATIRLHLLKVGARIVETSRRIWMHLSSSYPNQSAWLKIHQKLCT